MIVTWSTRVLLTVSLFTFILGICLASCVHDAGSYDVTVEHHGRGGR